MPGSIRGYPRLYVMLLFSMVVILAFGLAPPMAGAYTQVGPASWSGMTPADDSGVTQARPKISVTAFDPGGIKQTGYTILLDGVALRPSFSYKIIGWNGSTPILDKRYVTMNATIRSDIQYGWHAVQSRVTNNSNVLSEVAWSFWRTGAPTLDAPEPAPGSITTSRTPTLSVRVSSNWNGLTGSFTLDGFTVPGIFNQDTKVLSGIPTTSLAVGTHNASVTAANSFGYVASLAWRFSVDVRLPQTPVTDCVSCHTDQPRNHPMSNCGACHGPDAPLGETDVSGAPHSPYYIYSPEYACETCHGKSFATVPPLHPFSPDDPYHDTTSVGCVESECHARQLDSEHNRDGMTCLTCHTSTDPKVVAAIAEKNTACEACHSAEQIAHYALHESQITADCQSCHLINLQPEHLRTSSSSASAGCANCHPQPRNGLDNGGVWNKGCSQYPASPHLGTGCHVTLGPDAPHKNMDASHTVDPAAADCTEAGCHDATLPDIHVNATVTDAIGTRTGCNVCHTPFTMPSTTNCMTCHPTTDHYAKHEPVVVPTECAISGCHDATNLIPIHNKSTCPTCHQSADPNVVNAIGTGNRDCSACHPNAGDHKAVHQSAIALGCEACHMPNLVDEHGARGFTCATCHESAIPAVINAIASNNTMCDACHDFTKHQYPVEQHLANVANSLASGVIRDVNGNAYYYTDGILMTYGDMPCGQCHLMDLEAEHTKPSASVAAESCNACHPEPRQSFGTWNETCQDGGCHPTYHNEMATKHFETYGPSWPPVGCSQADSSCHLGYWPVGDLAAIHDQAMYNGLVFASVLSPPYQYGCAFCHINNQRVPVTPTSCGNNGGVCHVYRHQAAVFPW